MSNHLLFSKVSLLVLSLFIVDQDPCSAKFIPDSSKLKSGDLWLPRELGRFHLKDAGFVEVYERTPSEVPKDGESDNTYPEKYNLFITTFNAGNLTNSTILQPYYYELWIIFNLSKCIFLIPSGHVYT